MSIRDWFKKRKPVEPESPLHREAATALSEGQIQEIEEAVRACQEAGLELDKARLVRSQAEAELARSIRAEHEARERWFSASSTFQDLPNKWVRG